MSDQLDASIISARSLQPVVDSIHISAKVAELVKRSGENSKDHGFHDDWPKSTSITGRSPEAIEKHASEQRRAIAEKLALIHEEVSEALGEIRSGRDPLEVYFVDKKGVLGVAGKEYSEQQYNSEGLPLCKPEGFLTELGDAVIRSGDLAYLVGDEEGTYLADAIEIKHEFNRTRPYKHGRKF